MNIAGLIHEFELKSYFKGKVVKNLELVFGVNNLKIIEFCPNISAI